MANENAILEKDHEISVAEVKTDEFDFDELERKLQGDIENQLSDLVFLDEQAEQIGNPDVLGDVILETIWEQFTNQIAVQAGEDFVKENTELLGGKYLKDGQDNVYLDLSDKAHIQTTENFERGNFAMHNPDVDIYVKRYEETRRDFVTDPNIEQILKTKADNSKENIRYNETTHTLERFDKKSQTWKPHKRFNEETKNIERYDTEVDSWVGEIRYNSETKVQEKYDSRMKEWKKKLAPDARIKFDTRSKDQRGTGSIAKDHVISAAEQIRDMDAATHIDREGRKEFAKSDVNLQDLDRRANSSKGDMATVPWLDLERDGKKPAERFPIDEEKLRENDKKARKEYERQKEEAKKKAIEEGRESQKDETFRVGKKAVRAIVMNLLADLVKKMIKNFILWLKSANKNIKSLVNSFKMSITEFIGDLKNHVVNVFDTAITVIAESILGPVISTIKKAWMFIKQGWTSLKDAVKYIKDPTNKGKPVSILIMEVGKIVTGGLTAIGGIVLGEVIEKGLITVPIFAVEIPLFGSLANIIGIFMGAFVAGVIGALALNLINDMIAQKQKQMVTTEKVEKSNEIIKKQRDLLDLTILKVTDIEQNMVNNVTERHKESATLLKSSIEKIKKNSLEGNEKAFADIDAAINDLLD